MVELSSILPLPSYSEAVDALTARAAGGTQNLAVRNASGLALRLVAWCHMATEPLPQDVRKVMVEGLTDMDGLEGGNIRSAMGRESPFAALLPLPGAISLGRLDRAGCMSPIRARNMTHLTKATADDNLGVPSMVTLSAYDDTSDCDSLMPDVIHGLRRFRGWMSVEAKGVDEPVLVPPDRTRALSTAVRAVARSILRAEQRMGPRSPEMIADLADSLSRTRKLLSASESAAKAFLAWPGPERRKDVESALDRLLGLYEVDDPGGFVHYKGCMFGHPFSAHDRLRVLRRHLMTMYVQPLQDVMDGIEVSRYTMDRLAGDWYDYSTQRCLSKIRWHLSRSKSPDAVWR